MKLKNLILVCYLAAAHYIHAGENAIQTLDKAFFYFSRMTNRTDKDLYIEQQGVGKQPGKLIILKPGKTIKNVPIAVPKRMLNERPIRQLMIQVSDDQKRLGYLIIQVQPRNTAAGKETVTIKILSGPHTHDSWTEPIDLVTEKRIGFGIVVDFQGATLAESKLDVIAEIQQ